MPPYVKIDAQSSSDSEPSSTLRLGSDLARDSARAALTRSTRPTDHPGLAGLTPALAHRDSAPGHRQAELAGDPSDAEEHRGDDGQDRQAQSGLGGLPVNRLDIYALEHGCHRLASSMLATVPGRLRDRHL